MAKFTSKNIEFRDYQKAVFGTDDDAYLMWDDVGQQMVVSTVISGVDPTMPGHLVTKRYVDNITISGTTSSGITEQDYAEDDVESSTTSTSWTEKLSISSTVPDGDYIVLWSYEWRHSSTNNFFNGRVQLDNTQTIMEHSESPGNKDNWSPAGGLKRASLSYGTHTVDIDYNSSKSGKTSYIRRARLELWRI